MNLVAASISCKSMLFLAYWLRAGLAVPISVASLAALNVAQNGPEIPANLRSVTGLDGVPLQFEGSPEFLGDGGRLASGPYPSPPFLTYPESVLTLPNICATCATFEPALTRESRLQRDHAARSTPPPVGRERGAIQ